MAEEQAARPQGFIIRMGHDDCDLEGPARFLLLFIEYVHSISLS